MSTCVCQRSRNVLPSSRGGNLRGTHTRGRSRRSRNRRSLSSRIRSLCRSLCSLRIGNPEKQLVRRPGVSWRFPCRKHRTSPSSRRRFPPHRETFHDAVSYSASVYPLPVHGLMRMLRPPSPKIPRRFPTRVRPYSDSFVSKSASRATWFGLLPYLTSSVFDEWMTDHSTKSGVKKADKDGGTIVNIILRIQ
jgi:hypothetical protein